MGTSTQVELDGMSKVLGMLSLRWSSEGWGFRTTLSEPCWCPKEHPSWNYLGENFWSLRYNIVGLSQWKADPGHLLRDVQDVLPCGRRRKVLRERLQNIRCGQKWNYRFQGGKIKFLDNSMNTGLAK